MYKTKEKQANLAFDQLERPSYNTILMGLGQIYCSSVRLLPPDRPPGLKPAPTISYPCKRRVVALERQRAQPKKNAVLSTISRKRKRKKKGIGGKSRVPQKRSALFPLSQQRNPTVLTVHAVYVQEQEKSLPLSRAAYLSTLSSSLPNAIIESIDQNPINRPTSEPIDELYY